jgi:hypothetical protein
MKLKSYIVAIFVFGLFNSSSGQTKTKDSSFVIKKIEMALNVVGPEVGGYLTIHASIDLMRDSSLCSRVRLNPDYQGSTYILTKAELKSIAKLLRTADLENLKKQYATELSDQPRSTTKIYTTKKTFIFDDYGLVGDPLLQQLYRIVYKP